MRIIMLFLLNNILLVSGYSQIKETEENSVYWDRQKKLTWTDFQGVPPASYITTYNTEAMAGSAVKIGYHTEILGEEINVEVYCQFVKDKSWTKDTASQHGLLHEQLHFDIGELFARKIRKEISILKREDIRSYDVYKQKINDLLKEKDATNHRFDKETLHGEVDFSQQEWSKKIAKELAELEQYAVDYEEYLKDR